MVDVVAAYEEGVVGVCFLGGASVNREIVDLGLSIGLDESKGGSKVLGLTSRGDDLIQGDVEGSIGTVEVKTASIHVSSYLVEEAVLQQNAGINIAGRDWSCIHARSEYAS